LPELARELRQPPRARGGGLVPVVPAQPEEDLGGEGGGDDVRVFGDCAAELARFVEEVRPRLVDFVLLRKGRVFFVATCDQVAKVEEMLGHLRYFGDGGIAVRLDCI
jgi:hypothetical protein